MHAYKQIYIKSCNPHIYTYKHTHTHTGATCQSSAVSDGSPYALDPTFQRFSETYNGKIEVTSAYFSSERSNDTDRNPYAFFPHQHDPLTSAGAIIVGRRNMDKRKISVKNPAFDDLTKNSSMIHKPSVDLFKIYFDELPTGKQSDRMIAFLRDAKFIDSLTDTMQVDLVTYNAQLEIFCLCTFYFNWDTAGTIYWDYKFNT
jgi:hypothetical protein